MIWTIIFVSFGANLTHFEAKTDIHSLHHLLSSLPPTTYKGISDSAYFCTDWHQVQQIVRHKVGVGVGEGVGLEVGVRVGLGFGVWVADRVAVWVGVGVGV